MITYGKEFNTILEELVYDLVQPNKTKRTHTQQQPEDISDSPMKRCWAEEQIKPRLLQQSPRWKEAP